MHLPKAIQAMQESTMWSAALLLMRRCCCRGTQSHGDMHPGCLTRRLPALHTREGAPVVLLLLQRSMRLVVTRRRAQQQRCHQQDTAVVHGWKGESCYISIGKQSPQSCKFFNPEAQRRAGAGAGQQVLGAPG